MMVSDRPGNMLLNAFLQPLGCTSYVPTIAVAHKLIDNIIVVMGRLHPSWLREDGMEQLIAANSFPPTHR